MKIRTFYRLENGVYNVAIYTEEWSENDIRLMEKFGEPDINIGGDLTYETEDESAEPVTWHIDDQYRRVMSDPIFMSFDSRDTPLAKEFANLWGREISQLLEQKYLALHNLKDDFTRETVNTLTV